MESVDIAAVPVVPLYFLQPVREPTVSNRFPSFVVVLAQSFFMVADHFLLVDFCTQAVM